MTSPSNTSSTPQSLPLQQSAQQDPFAEMRNLHLPQAIDSWPWAPGWYILITLVVVGLSLGIYFYIKRKRENLYKAQALQSLENIKKRTSRK